MDTDTCAEVSHALEMCIRDRAGRDLFLCHPVSLLRQMVPGLFSVCCVLLGLLVLAVVAALGTDINVVAGQAGAQAGVLTLIANGKAQLLVGHGDAAGAGLAGQQLHLCLLYTSG